MEIEISEDIKKLVTQCPSDFLCLKSGEKPKCFVNSSMCKLECQIGDNWLIITPGSREYCPYLAPHGNNFTCKCAVRQEIYKKYKI